MAERKNILSIGRDSTICEIGSQLHTRATEYDKYHTFTTLVMNPGKEKSVQVGNSRAVLVGGSNIITAFLKTFFSAFREAKKNQFDLVTTQDVLYAGLVGLFIAKVFKIPLYVQVHGDHLDNERWFKSKVGKFNRLMNVVGKYILKRGDQVRAVSERLRKQLISNYNLDPEKIISIPIGTDLAKFAPNENVKRQKTIAFAQRLILEKCPFLLVAVTSRILKKYPDVNVSIAGDGVLRGEMEEMYRKSGLLSRVNFLGMVDHQSLVSLYQSSFCYLHTADWEGWGMPMIEAMATGCPVVTTDTGCAGEAIRHNETGLVTSINDEDALVAEVERLLDDDRLWKNLSKQGIIEAQQWSFSVLARKNMEWYGR